MMKYVFFLFALLLSARLSAQHCPFDGYNLLAITLVDSSGKIAPIPKDSVYLIEVNHDSASLCNYSPGLIRRPFLSQEDFLTSFNRKLGPVMYEVLKKRIQNKAAGTNASLFVNITFSEKINIANKQENRKEKLTGFAVVWCYKNKYTCVPVLAKSICSLCTSQGDLKDFKPIIINID